MCYLTVYFYVYFDPLCSFNHELWHLVTQLCSLHGGCLVGCEFIILSVQVFLLKKSVSSPIITAVVNMPVSEPQIV